MQQSFFQPPLFSIKILIAILLILYKNTIAENCGKNSEWLVSQKRRLLIILICTKTGMRFDFYINIASAAIISTQSQLLFIKFYITLIIIVTVVVIVQISPAKKVNSEIEEVVWG